MWPTIIALTLVSILNAVYFAVPTWHFVRLRQSDVIAKRDPALSLSVPLLLAMLVPTVLPHLAFFASIGHLPCLPEAVLNYLAFPALELVFLLRLLHVSLASAASQKQMDWLAGDSKLAGKGEGAMRWVERTERALFHAVCRLLKWTNDLRVSQAVPERTGDNIPALAEVLHLAVP